jgi:hypothetical protein
MLEHEASIKKIRRGSSFTDFIVFLFKIKFESSFLMLLYYQESYQRSDRRCSSFLSEKR